MSILCTRCEGTGFLNAFQLPECLLEQDAHLILEYINENPGHFPDVCVCDCCGDTEDWYGQPGEHYSSEDPSGTNGPYAYNGGLCECH